MAIVPVYCLIVHIWLTFRQQSQYKGPKGVKIGCVLDDEMSKEGLKLQTDVAVTTPKYLTKLLRDGDVQPDKLRAIIFDEADLSLEQTQPDDLKLLFDNDDSREFSRITYLVGASVTESLGNLAVRDKIIPEGNSFIATATKFAPLTKESAVLETSKDSEDALFARDGQRDDAAKRIRQAMKGAKGQFLEDFQSGLAGSKMFQHRDQIRGRDGGCDLDESREQKGKS